ncbi:hypothetical protein AYI70_g7822 [Smittium culicis]|uniref:Uncharacterized protein n=1 Tax=Smittium culicis TaxID=133412 RepID=A0A1R1XIS7_9FUNG|nr:hypothetical protein AYI70_g7822 [Smittium culicis]
MGKSAKSCKHKTRAQKELIKEKKAANNQDEIELNTVVSSGRTTIGSGIKKRKQLRQKAEKLGKVAEKLSTASGKGSTTKNSNFASYSKGSKKNADDYMRFFK